MTEPPSDSTPPLNSNEQILDAIKSGELGNVVDLRPEAQIPEIEKQRMAKMQAEQELTDAKKMVFSGLLKEALIHNFLEIAESMEKQAVHGAYKQTMALQVVHSNMEAARRLRWVAEFVGRLKHVDEQEQTKQE